MKGTPVKRGEKFWRMAKRTSAAALPEQHHLFDPRDRAGLQPVEV